MLSGSNKITIIALGSRGDVQPFLALGKGLRDSGFEVTFATHLLFRNFVTRCGLKFIKVVPDNPVEFLRGKRGRLFASGNRLSSFIGGYFFFSQFRSQMEQMIEDSYRASLNSRLIICNPVSPGYLPAEKLQVPCITAAPWPAYPTRKAPHPVVTANLGGTLNRWSYSAVKKLLWMVTGRAGNRWRLKHGMKPLRSPAQFMKYIESNDFPWLMGISPAVFPRPRDWPDKVHMTGTWFLEEDKDWQPDEELERFLDEGSPPVYFGFGSMIHSGQEKILEMILKALQMTGQRGIIQSGWSRFSREKVPEYAMIIGPAPHSWLFPRMSALIHHGGSGTSAAGLRAGVPSLIIPFLADQFFWGRRVKETGAGPGILPKKKITAQRLAEKIHAMVSDSDMKRKAGDISFEIKKERGTERAVDIIRELVR